MDSKHVVVVGAGIVGASIAFRVASRGVRVTLIDRDQPGFGASSHSFAWINAGAKEPVGYHNLNRRSLEMWPRFADALGEDVGLRWGGKVAWEADPEAASALISRVEQLQSWGYPSRLVSREELQETRTRSPNRGLRRRRLQRERGAGRAPDGRGCLRQPPPRTGILDTDRR